MSINYVYSEGVLKTVAPEHTDFSGPIETVREYPDCIIHDHATIVKKIKSAEDAEGNCYGWYRIVDHYRYIDNSPRVKAEYEVLLCDMDEANEAAHAEYETALCDIDETLNGGTV